LPSRNVIMFCNPYQTKRKLQTCEHCSHGPVGRARTSHSDVATECITPA
jgi:hypothetical protein